MRRAWPEMEPGQPLVWGWALDAICDHLQAVSEGHIKRLAIAVPPGMSKSTSTCVYHPAWEWGPREEPWQKHICFSYNASLSTRDNLRCRRLITSEWYRKRWGHVFSLTADQNEKVNFQNDKTGFRFASSISGASTGHRGSRLIIDDPISVHDSFSDAKILEAQRFIDEVLPTRVIDPKNSAIVMIAQRTHERDPIGHVLARELGYEALILPMLYEPERRCITGIGFVDPRERDGDLLFPERFPTEVVERDKKAMGSFAFSAQMQQSPAPRGGGLIKVERLVPADDWPRNARAVRAWDFAASEARAGADPDYTVGAKLAEQDGMYWIVDIVRGRWDPGDVEKIVATTAWRDGPNCIQFLEQEPGSSGKAFVDHYRRTVLKGYAVQAEAPTGSKVQRAVPFAASVEAGNVRLVKGDWNEEFLAEARTFPVGAHDDQLDACAAAWTALGPGNFLYVG